MIPAALTRGKNHATIAITNISLESEWTEYHYKVLSLFSFNEPNTGDFDADGDVDQSDFAHLQQCLTGVGQTTPPHCTSADMDSDGDVDLYDRARFELCATAPGILVDETCLDEVIVDLPPDFDDDGDVDQSDFGIFQLCLSGTNISYPTGCEQADFDTDGDVDKDDTNAFIQCLSGPNQPYDPNCLD